MCGEVERELVEHDRELVPFPALRVVQAEDVVDGVDVLELEHPQIVLPDREA